MTFTLIGDKNYRECMRINAAQIERLHPDAKIVIGDLGGNSDWPYPVIDLSGQTHREAFMMMKPLLLASLYYGEGGVLLMDGDTILLKPFDLEDALCHAIVTNRQSRHGRLNSGVVFCNDQMFAIHWLKNGIKRMAKGNLHTEQLCEQWALIDTVDQGKFTVKEVPCDIYNYSNVSAGIPDDVRIVHLKSGRYKDTKTMQMIKDRL